MFNVYSFCSNELCFFLVCLNLFFEGHMLENCKRLICSPSLNKVYCIVLLYCLDVLTSSPT